MKQGFIRKMTSLFKRSKDRITTSQITTTVQPRKPRTRRQVMRDELKVRRLKRHNRYDLFDMKHVSGQARIAARAFRKLEYRQRRKLRPPLFPIPEKAS